MRLAVLVDTPLAIREEGTAHLVGVWVVEIWMLSNFTFFSYLKKLKDFFGYQLQLMVMNSFFIKGKNSKICEFFFGYN